MLCYAENDLETPCAPRSSIETDRARERLRNDERRGNNFEGPLLSTLFEGMRRKTSQTKVKEVE